MANVGSAPAGKTLVGNGDGASPTYVDIGENSGLTAHGVVVAEGNSAFVALNPGSAGQVLVSNGAGIDPSFQNSSASGAVTTVTGNSGVASPAAGNVNLVTANSTVKFVGSGSTVTQDFGLDNLLQGSSGPSITSATANAGYGQRALNALSTGSGNTAIGYQAGLVMNTCTGNTAVGSGALDSATSSSSNTGIGLGALNTLDTGTGSNTAVGLSALLNIQTGNNNTALGVNAGADYTLANSNNISIGNRGLVGESNAIRIGTEGSGTSQQNKAFVAGISTATVAASAPVGVDTNGQLSNLGFGSSGQVFRSGGAGVSPAWSTATFPGTAGTTGTLLQSNGTNFVNTTATYPGTAGTTGTILRSDGTNIVNTTATYPATTTVNQILYSASANAISGLVTGNNFLLLTNGSGVPSFGNTLAGNFSFSIGTAGSTEAVTVANNDNTNASSNAVVIHTTGGTSAGDAYDRYVIGTARSYAAGIDNSDTQSYKINTTNSGTVTPSTGSTVMRIDNSGNVTKPLNACCTVDLTTGVANATGDATLVNPVIFDTETGSFFDQNANYNPATGIFTANATGKYLVTARVTLDTLGAAHTTGAISLLLNGAAFMFNQFNPFACANAAGEYTATISSILPLTTAQTCAVNISVTGGTKTVGIKGNTFGSYTSLSVVLVS